MWQIEKIKAKNFGTHRDTEFKINQGVTTMIAGVNLDDLGAQSNGSGKSTIGDMISVLLTGTSLKDKLKITELITDGETFFEVEGWLKNDLTKEDIWIYRKYNSSSSGNVLKILLNDKEPESLVQSTNKGGMDIKEGVKWIFEKLGITKDDFFNYYLLSRDTFQSFLLSTDGKMKEVINRFSNAELVDPVFELLNNDIKDIDSKIAVLEKQKTRNLGKIEAYEEEIKELLTEGKDEVIKELQEKINNIKDSNNVLEEEKKQFSIKIKSISENIKIQENELAELEEKNASFDGVKNDFTIKLEKLNESLKSKKTMCKQFDKIKSDIEKQLHDSITCPECNHKFDLKDEDFDFEDSQSKLEEVNDSISQLVESVEKRENQIIAAKEGFEEHHKQIDELNQQIRSKKESIENLKSTLKMGNRKLELNDNEIRSNIKKIERYESDIQDILDLDNSSISRDLEVKIDTIKVENDGFQNQIDAHIITKQDYTEQVLKFQKFKTYLANQCISTIEGQTNFFLEKINTNLRIKINGFRELKNGSIKEEIEPIVLRNGFERGSIRKFSGGEKGKLILCNIFALQRIINENSPSGGLDFSLFDEILESIDYRGMVDIDHSMNAINQTVKIVSHVKDVGFTNEIFIKKENETSKIIDKIEFLKHSLNGE